MKRTFVLLGLLALLATAGCKAHADVNLPSYGGWGNPPPPSYIAPASPNSRSDLQRENSELKARVAYLEEQNRKSSRKYDDLGKDMSEIRADMDKIAAERDRYRRSSGY